MAGSEECPGGPEVRGETVDPYLVTLAGEAGTAVVALLVGEGWQQARDGVVAVWRRYRPQSADHVGRELEASRRVLLAAPGSADTAPGEGLAGDWQRRLVDLLDEHPGAAEDLRALLTRLAPAPIRQQDIRGGVRMRARASGSARIYQAAGDQHITER